MTNPICSVGIIMDGNRRWAKERGLPIWEGHKAGADVLRELGKKADYLHEQYGLEFVTLYTFSTENWKRESEEVEYLMNTIREEFKGIADTLDKQNIRVRVLGNREAFDEDIQTLFKEVEEGTKDNTGITIAFALSYGGRDEIVRAINKAMKKEEAVTEESFELFLDTSGIPDPDIVIRTSGERRLSGFLPWQTVYSELFFTKTYWPDFTAEELEELFKEYQERERRHGK